MTFMPRFIEPSAEFPHQHQIKLEAVLLKERSHEKLTNLPTQLAAPKSVYASRLEAELRILEDNGYCGYFLIVADYVDWAKANGIAVGPGRGSGPCSLVGFVLGITSIDPIKYNLPFERFVNPERDQVPDFDLDFCAERRKEVSAYIQSKHGVDRVAQISSDDTRPLPSRLVICDRPLAELVTLYSNPESGFPTARMNLAQIASAGLVQFNVINQKALTIIQRVTEKLAIPNTSIEINNIALNDANTYRLLSTGETTNIAELDHEHYKAALIAVQPQRFEELYATLALSYPRLRGYIQTFTERQNNAASIQYFHPALESITAETYGLILYQEQVMHIAHKIAGFPMAEADSFRRALRKSDREAICMQKSKFVDGAINFGLAKSEATGLFEHLAISEPRTFNKSHAVAYAMLAYQTAWLKTNYSDAFAEVMSTL